MDAISIKSPISPETTAKLKAGMRVLISGTIYTARDAAHKRLTQALERGEKPPFDIKGQTIYYTGPAPSRPGQVIGSAGPTTSRRMDGYTPKMLSGGLRAIIGKGNRSTEVTAALKRYKAVYFAATGGTGALLTKTIKKAEVVAFEDLGTEAILKLTVEDFPAIVANDSYGGDIFREGKAKYRRR